jgi:hypothetical protein
MVNKCLKMANTYFLENLKTKNKKIKKMNGFYMCCIPWSIKRSYTDLITKIIIVYWS